MYAKDFKEIAWKKSKPYVGTLMLITLIFLIITDGFDIGGQIDTWMHFDINKPWTEYTSIYTSIGSIIALIVGGAFEMSWALISRYLYDDQQIVIKDIFEGFNEFGRSLGINLLNLLYCFLWGFWSLGIGAIIKAYSYSMAYYIADDNPGMSANECITKSKEMMAGNKWRLFCLDFSFIGWYILSILTFGILSLYIIPKHRLARYAFYRDLF